MFAPSECDLPFFSPGRAKKRHSFHDWRNGRREALSTPKARRGAEASTAHLAARSCTSGVDRRSRTKHEASPGNECRIRWSSRRLHLIAFRGALRQEQAAWMGSVERQFHRRSQRGKGRSRLPTKESSLDRRVSLRAHRNALRMEKTRPVHGRIVRWPSTRGRGVKWKEQPATDSTAPSGCRRQVVVMKDRYNVLQHYI